jgi:hypothetical protein
VSRGGAFETRSDDKGPEPEDVTLGKVAGRTYAFIGLERVDGGMVYDISDPRTPFVGTFTETYAAPRRYGIELRKSF